MKKLSFLLVIVSTFAFMTSCVSDESFFETEIKGQSNMRVVTYNVSNTDSKLKVALPESDVKSLIYLVYNQSGNLYKYKTWNKGQDIAVINDTLPQGNYTVAFYASTSTDAEVNIDFASSNLNSLNDGYIYLKDMLATDMFFHSSPLVIGGEDVSKAVLLSRMIGRVSVSVSDIANIPSDVASVQFALAPNHPVAFMLGNQQTVFAEYTEANYKFFMPVTAEMTRAQFITAAASPISFYSLPGDATYNPSALPVDLYCIIKKTNGKEVMLYLKQDLQVIRNKTINLTGTLFDKYNSSADYSNIQIDDQWGETINDTF